MNYLRMVVAIIPFLIGGCTNAANMSVVMTAYTSTVGQTDSTPFITATGTRVRPGVAAASPDIIAKYGHNAIVKIISYNSSSKNCHKVVPVGTQLVLEDSTSKRKTNTIDVWLSSYKSAITFGRCYANVQILTRK